MNQLMRAIEKIKLNTYTYGQLKWTQNTPFLPGNKRLTANMTQHVMLPHSV